MNSPETKQNLKDMFHRYKIICTHYNSNIELHTSIVIERETVLNMTIKSTISLILCSFISHQQQCFTVEKGVFKTNLNTIFYKRSPAYYQSLDFTTLKSKRKS